MNDQAFNPPIQTKTPMWCCDMVTLDSRPDELFESGKADERRDGDDRMIGVRVAGQWIRDVVLDREGDFVGGDGWELGLGCRGDGVDGVDGGRVMAIWGFDRRALRH